MRGVILAAYAATACSLPDQKYDSLACHTDLAPTTAPAVVTVVGQVADPYENLPVGGASVIAYQGTTPLPFDVTTSETGGFGSGLPTGGVPLDAYFQINAPGFVTVNYYPGAPIAADLQVTAEMITPDELVTIGSAANDTPAGSGTQQIILAVVDCDENPVAGAHVTVASGTVFYLNMDRPDPTATATDVLTGAALDLNITGTGDIAVSATYDDGASQIMFHNHAVDVSPGTITETEIVP